MTNFSKAKRNYNLHITLHHRKHNPKMMATWIVCLCQYVKCLHKQQKNSKAKEVLYIIYKVYIHLLYIHLYIVCASANCINCPQKKVLLFGTFSINNCIVFEFAYQFVFLERALQRLTSAKKTLHLIFKLLYFLLYKIFWREVLCNFVEFFGKISLAKNVAQKFC